ncbi:DUF4236 domain-containing protein [Chryseotalea sanaruensis]|uniref:DUF4236 domain-containing protein n=1 Tax=Chryseotalea sanaruensis TaxID=2482724 RepID=UPI000F8D9F36|nr:DUF4236 domain-containing protein [Chryseotalea sanaruensis]
MSLRYQKRVNLGKGLGLNVSPSGLTPSYRTKHGSISTKGFSIRTGISGLSFRSSWARSKEGLVLMLLFGIILIGGLVIYNLIHFVLYLFKRLYHFIQDKRQQRELKRMS